MKQPTIIDVREPVEFTDSHVEGALNIPIDELKHGTKRLNDLDKNEPIIVYCNTGRRSQVAQDVLKDDGFRDVINGISKQDVETRLGT